MPFGRLDGRRLFFALLLVTSASALHSFGQNTNAAHKKPWEWTLDERIAERCDRQAARARVERARAHRVAPTTRKDGRVEWVEIADQISGEDSPHLFLPAELFESVVRNAFVLEGWREMFVARANEAGLPPTFWDDLERVSTLYIEDLREEHRITQSRDRATANSVRQAIYLRQCANRAEALAKARAIFGAPLDVFLYRHVAPTKSVFTDDLPDPVKLKAREKGCR